MKGAKFSKVVGLTFVPDYPHNLNRLADAFGWVVAGTDHPQPDKPPAEFRRNPSNIHDANAVEVHTPAVGMVGHLPREVAAIIAPAMDAGTQFWVWCESIERNPHKPLNPGLRLGFLQRK